MVHRIIIPLPVLSRDMRSFRLYAGLIAIILLTVRHELQRHSYPESARTAASALPPVELLGAASSVGTAHTQAPGNCPWCTAWHAS